jgi:hypothetical protein
MAYLLKTLAVSFALVISSSDVAVDAFLLSSEKSLEVQVAPSDISTASGPPSVVSLSRPPSEPDSHESHEHEKKETFWDQMVFTTYDPNTWVERVLLGYELDKFMNLEGASKDQIRAAVLGAKELINAVGAADAAAEGTLNHVVADKKKVTEYIAKWNKAAGFDHGFSHLDKPQQLAFFYWLMTDGEKDEEKFIKEGSVDAEALVEDLTLLVNAVREKVRTYGTEGFEMLKGAVEHFSLPANFGDVEKAVEGVWSQGLEEVGAVLDQIPGDMENCLDLTESRVRDLLLPSKTMEGWGSEGLLDGGGFKLVETFVKAGLKFKLKQFLESDRLNLDEKTKDTVFHWLEKLMNQMVDKSGSALAAMVHSLATGSSKGAALAVGEKAACASTVLAGKIWLGALAANVVLCHAKAGHEESCEAFAKTMPLLERRMEKGGHVKKTGYYWRRLRNKTRILDALRRKA